MKKNKVNNEKINAVNKKKDKVKKQEIKNNKEEEKIKIEKKDKKIKNSIFSLSDFIKYLKYNSISVFLISIICFITQGYWINKNFSYFDVDIFINNPETIYNWMDIGRFRFNNRKKYIITRNL